MRTRLKITKLMVEHRSLVVFDWTNLNPLIISGVGGKTQYFWGAHTQTLELFIEVSKFLLVDLKKKSSLDDNTR